MKKDSNFVGGIGAASLIISVVLFVVAWSMDVTVDYEGTDIVNIGKLDERRSYLLMAVFLFAVGIFFVNNGRPRRSANQIFKEMPSENPPCERDLSLSGYKIWLVKRYGIGKNDVLGSFVCREELFPTVEDAMEYAHAIELGKVKARDEKKKKADAEKIQQKEREEKERLEQELHEEEERKKRLVLINFFLGPCLDLVRALRGYFRKNEKARYFVYGIFLLVCGLSVGVIYGEVLKKQYYDAHWRYTNAYLSFEDGNSEWKAARIIVGKRLEADAKAKIKFVLVNSSSDNRHYVQLINQSEYIAGDIDGELSLFSSGVRFPNNSVPFKCCQTGVAPGQAFTQKEAIAMDSSLSEIGKKNFAKINEIPLVKFTNGKLDFPLDSKVIFDGSITFLVVDASGDSRIQDTTQARRVDFLKEAEKLPEVSELYASDGATLLEFRSAELEDAKSKLIAWRNFLKKIHLD